MNWKSGTLFLVAAVVLAGAVLLANRSQVEGQGGKMGLGAQYTVINTDGAHLIVTDDAKPQK
jgi:hypothetical protein